MKNSFGQKIFDNLLTMLADEKFRDEVIAIKEKFHIPDSGVDEEYRKTYGMNNDGHCFEALDELRVKYKLNEHYSAYLMQIILFAKIPDKAMISFPKPFELIHYKEESGMDCAVIKIYSETTLEDINKNWAEIENFKIKTYDHKIKHLRPYKNAKRDFYIRALKRFGVTNKNSSRIINNVFPLLTTIGYEDIPKIIKKNKTKAAKLLKINNKNK